MPKGKRKKEKLDVEGATENTRSKLKLLRELIKLNDPASVEAWVTSFNIMVASAFHQNEASYQDFCNHLDQCKVIFKHMWD